MSNFFTNLVTRSFVLAPNVLQPRVPSQFETPAGSEPVLEETANSHRRAETTETIADSPAMAQPRPERYRVSENPRETYPRTEPSRETYARHQTILPVVPEEGPRVQIKSQSEERVVAAPIVRAEESRNERTQIIRPRVEATTRPVQEKDESKSIQVSMPRLVPHIPGQEPSHPIHQAENNTDTKLFPLEDRSPTVRIHIGRIEVRAVTQPAAPARMVVPNRPKLTLDEYLLRRNEGKR